MCQPPTPRKYKRDALEGAAAIVKYGKSSEELSNWARTYHTSSALKDMQPHWHADAALRWANAAAREAVKAGAIAVDDRTPQAILAAAIVMLSTRSEYVK